MKKLLSVTALMLSGSVVAQTGYVGGGLASVDYSIDGIPTEAQLSAVFGRLGTEFNENFSGELRLGFGIGNDTVSAFGVDGTVELNNLFGAYIRGGIPVSDSFFPYVVVGYTRGEMERDSAILGSDSPSESDISFGIGADLGVSESLTASIEYMNYLDKDGADVSGFSLSFISRF
jgi:outer membrane immunogenic protein